MSLLIPYSFFIKMGHSRPLFLYFRLFNTVDSKQMFHIKVCQWLDSNGGPLVSEATTLPTQPQPRPIPFSYLGFCQQQQRGERGLFFFRWVLNIKNVPSDWILKFTRLSFRSSVTRWLDYFSLFATHNSSNLPKILKNCQSRFKILPNKKQTLRSLLKIFES